MLIAAPSPPISTNFGESHEIADASYSAKFHVDRLRDFGLAGARISHVHLGKHAKVVLNTLLNVFGASSHRQMNSISVRIQLTAN
jgi:hypothetical protein